LDFASSGDSTSGHEWPRSAINLNR
jgi:hypothetical protein